MLVIGRGMHFTEDFQNVLGTFLALGLSLVKLFKEPVSSYKNGSGLELLYS